MALSPFTWSGGGRRMTPEEIAFQRRIAARQMQSDYSPIYSPWQGLARVADNVTGALRDRGASRAQERNAAEQRELLASLLMQPAAQPQPQMTMPAPEGTQALSPDDFAASIAASLQQAEPIDLTSTAPTQAYQDAIAAIESGAKGYGAIGPTHPGMGRALGKYQVMEANIGPWSQEALGRALTPEEFLASPEAQDAIFNHKFGEYAERFGPGGAAEAWFAGPGGVGRNRRDSLGTSTQDYRQRFLAGLGDAGAAANPVAEALMMDGAAPTEPTPQEQSSHFAMAQPAQQPAINPAIVEALASPYTDGATKQIAMALFQQQAAGPAAQQLVKAGDGVLYDPGSGQWLTAPGYGQQRQPESFRALEARAHAAGLQPGTAEYQQFMRAGGAATAADGTAPEQKIARLTENLLGTGDFNDPRQARLVAGGIVDGRLRVDRDPITGVAQIVDVATGRVVRGPQGVPPTSGMRQQSEPPVATPSTDAVGAERSFGAEGFARSALNRAADIAGQPVPFPSTQEHQANFAVLSEMLTNDVASAYGRQPPSWLLKGIRDLAPDAGALTQGASGAQAKLRALRARMQSEREQNAQLLQRRMSPQNQQQVESRVLGLDMAIGRIDGALGGFGGRQEQSAAQPGAAAPRIGDVRKGYRFKGGNPADRNSWEKVS